MHFRRGYLALVAVPVLAIGLAACGSSNSDSSSSNAASSTPAQTSAVSDTVSTKSVGGVGTVLVDSTGDALYTNDMDKGTKIACAGQCLTEWVPLAAPQQGNPSSSDSAVMAKLGTVGRPDGTSQVTFNGMPLYSFVEDSSGQVTGDGFSDSFGGINFVWTAARASGGSAGSAPATTTQQSSGGYGGSM